jgi:hypothetical protein
MPLVLLQQAETLMRLEVDVAGAGFLCMPLAPFKIFSDASQLPFNHPFQVDSHSLLSQ